MRQILLAISLVILSACRSPTGNADHPGLRPGAYRGDHGTIASRRGMESELILDSSGTFRFFLIDSNTAVFTSKGEWDAAGMAMVWSGISRSYLYHGGFRLWDTLAAPDTSFLRNISDDGFERLEVSTDSQYASILRWVRYAKIAGSNPLEAGAYEFLETFSNGVHAEVIDTGLTRLEISSPGPYVQRLFVNGILSSMDVDSRWYQEGTFLITGGNRHCGYETGYTSCGDAPPEYEYVARLSHVSDTGFHLWIAPDFTFQSGPFWAGFTLLAD